MDLENAQHEAQLAPPATAPASVPAPAATPALSGFAAGMGNAAFATTIAGIGRPRGVARAARPVTQPHRVAGDGALSRAVIARSGGEHTCKCGGAGASCTCGGHEHDEEELQLRRAVARRVARNPVATPAAAPAPEPNQSVGPGAPVDAGAAPAQTDAAPTGDAPAAGPVQANNGIGAPPPGVDTSGGSGAPAEIPASGVPAVPPGFVLIPTQDPEISCKPGTPGLNIDLDEAAGAAGPVGEHIPAPVLKMPNVPHPPPPPAPKLLDPSTPPPQGNPTERFERDAGALLSLSMAIKEANARGPQLAGAAGISNDQLRALHGEMGKAEGHAKKATEAQTALKRDAAAIRTMPAVRAAAVAYQEKYREFEKTVRDTKPKVHKLKAAAADLASVQAAQGAKKETAEADKKQAEVDKVKKQADQVIEVGVTAIKAFSSGGWAGVAKVVGDAALDLVVTEAKSIASGMVMKLLKPDIEQTQAEITNARAKAARLSDESEAKALESKLEGFRAAATELSNAQKDIEAGAKALMEAEGGFAAALKSAGLSGAIKAITLRREMRQLHGTAMQAVNAFQDGLDQNNVLIADAVGLYTHVLNMACNAQKLSDVSAPLGAAGVNLGVAKQLRGWGKREQGACASDRTKLGEWLAGYDILAEDLTAILALIPK